MAQSIKWPTPDFCSGYHLQVGGLSSSSLGSALGRYSLFPSVLPTLNKQQNTQLSRNKDDLLAMNVNEHTKTWSIWSQ